MPFVDSSTTYSLISLDSGLCVGARADDQSAFAKLTMQDWQGLAGQRWAFISRGGQDFLLHNPKLEAYVAMHEASPFLVTLAEEVTAPWHLIPAEQKSFYYIYSPTSARCAAPFKEAPFKEGVGAPIHGQLLANQPSQKWLLQPVEVHVRGGQGYRFDLLDSGACVEPLSIEVQAGAPSLAMRLLPADESRGGGESEVLGFELLRPDGSVLGPGVQGPRTWSTSTSHGLLSCLIAEPMEGEWKVRFLRTDGVFSFASMVDAAGDKEGVAEAGLASLSEPTRRHMRSILAAEALARTTTAADHDGPNTSADPSACILCRTKWILVADLMREHAAEPGAETPFLGRIAELFELDTDQALQYAMILSATRKRLWAQRWCQLLGRCI